MSEAPVPFLDLGSLHQAMLEELKDEFVEVVRGSAFVGGPQVKRFEEEFAAAHGRAYAVGCASGTDALALSLRAVGVGPGDEVVVPSMTFVATAEAVWHAGATPVIADVDAETLLLSPALVDDVRTDRTRAVVPVHLYGHVVPFEHVEQWNTAGFAVIEDAAQAHLASYKGQVVGTAGTATCFSFYPGKNLGALGDAGAVVTDDEAVADQVRRKRDHGRTEKYVHRELGYSSRLDGLQAAMLRVKLPYLRRWTEARRVVASLYRERLAPLSARGIDLIPWEDGAVHHLLVVRLRDRDRDEVQRRLRELGIGTGIHYPVTLSQQPSLSPWHRPTPEAEAAASSILSLPMDPGMTATSVDRVVEALVAATV